MNYKLITKMEQDGMISSNLAMYVRSNAHG